MTGALTGYGCVLDVDDSICDVDTEGLDAGGRGRAAEGSAALASVFLSEIEVWLLATGGLYS